MATVYGRQEGDGSHTNWSNLPAEVPKFFKIVLDPGDERLRVPPEFMRRYGRNLTNCVSLRVPCGSLWKVELIRSNGETWLNQGWRQFKEYYSLSFGHFLLFLYDGNSHFDVRIFDTTASEIEYVHDGSRGGEVHPKPVGKMNGTRSESEESVVFLKEIFTRKNRKGKNGEEDDQTVSNVYVDILDKHPAGQEKKRKIPEANDLKRTDKKSDDCPSTKSACGVQNISSREKRDSGFIAPSPNYQSKFGRACRVKLEDCKEGITTIDRERCITYKRAQAFMSNEKSQNSFYIVVMQPSSVNYGFLARIGFSFARGNLPCTKNNLTLRVSEEKTWPVTCIIRPNRAILSGGWVKFVKDNALKLLPPTFVREWGERFPRIAKLRIRSGQTWDVKLEKMEDMEYYFTRGWTKFSEDLGLEKGELLVFQFTGKATFDVSVYGLSCCEREISATNSPVKDCDPDKADKLSTNYTCMNHCSRADHVGRVKVKKEDVIAPQDNSKLRFSKKLKQCDSHKLYIPKEFAARTGIAENKMIHLQDSKSRSWPVNISSWKNRSCSWFALGGGWNNFLVSNRVPVGSTILIECEASSGTGSLIKATVLNKGKKGGELFQSSRTGKGRPYKLHKPVGNINSVSSREEKCAFF